MEIIDYCEKYKNDVKKLLRELQEYIVSLDPYKYNIINNDYEDKCFEIDYDEVLNKNGKIYLALEENNVVGLVIGIINKDIHEYDYERNGYVGEIIELIVTKNTRSKGIGKQLIKKMELYFKDNNCETINIDVFGYNDIAKDFYFKNGYHLRMMTVSKKIDEV